MLSTKGKVVVTHATISPEYEALPKSIQSVMQLLNQPLRVEISDGRIIIGLFHCLDHEKNLILTDANEYRYPHNDDDEVPQTPSKRFLGMALVPGKHIVKVSQLAIS
ncbi:hypothetical protein THRCLA_23030 [Thraustotheca clavata]|uniref:Sm domain-containing protein n=1 Tax=Thraustotheca clavata TaxID=74557 RepID=A0A1V9YI69_9STRA|nr:hypothetical protein THRCLA_23030 [Thraustotheca clavata]